MILYYIVLYLEVNPIFNFYEDTIFPENLRIFDYNLPERRFNLTNRSLRRV